MSTSFNFPANPTLNQIVVLPDGNSAQWNGYAWVSVTDNPTYPLEIPKGGTGATNPSTARVNLGLDAATGERMIPKDGTVALPGLAFLSEPGLGWYRRGPSWIAMAAQGKEVFDFTADAGASTISAAPMAANTQSQLFLVNQPATAANYNYLTVAATGAGGAAISTGAAGTATRKALTLDAPQVWHNDGTPAAPSIAFSSEPGLGWYRQGASVFGTAAQGLKTSELGAAGGTSTYMGLYPRAIGGTALYLASYPAGATDGRTLAVSTDSSGHHIFESLAGAATTKGVDIAFTSVLMSRGTLILGGGTSYAYLTMNGAAANGKDISTQSNGVNRWLMRLGEGSPADDFVLWAYDDSQTLRETVRAKRDGSLLTISPPAIAANLFTGNQSVVAGNDGTLGRTLGVGPGGAWWRVTKDTSTVVRMYWNNDANHAFYYDISLGVYGFGTNGGAFVFNNDGDTAQKKNAGAWAAGSDARIKERIEDYTPGLEAILKFRPRVFSFKAETGYDPSERHVGMVSQEAMVALPDTVTVSPNSKLGTLDVPDLLNFNPTNITYALINAVKTLNQRLEAIGA